MKTMKKNIVLKLLTGVITMTITTTGIAVPMMAGSEQNREDVSVIVDKDIQVAETVVDTKIIGDDPHIVEDETVAEDEAIVEEDAEAEDTAEVKEDTEVEGNESTDTESAQLTSTPEQAAQSTSTPRQAAQSTSTPEQSVQPTREPVHEHNWIAQTNQRWVSQIVTVVDEPERYEEYGIFKIYWYNTGTWEETRDPDRFTEWAHSEYGSLYPFYYINNYEDDPLFLGYNELGQPSFTSDHALWTGYDFIPAVTHEEDQGYYETYVDYYYCDCGATK